MRISNVNQYLGGADAVVSQEILDGNQITKTITAEGIDFTGLTMDVDVELFKATIATTGRAVTITDFAKETAQAARSLTGAISAQGNGTFNLTVPKTLLSGFTPAPAAASPDATNPYVVAMKVQWAHTGGDVRSIRFLWIIRYQPNVGTQI